MNEIIIKFWADGVVTKAEDVAKAKEAALVEQTDDE